MEKRWCYLPSEIKGGTWAAWCSSCCSRCVNLWADLLWISSFDCFLVFLWMFHCVSSPTEQVCFVVGWKHRIIAFSFNNNNNDELCTRCVREREKTKKLKSWSSTLQTMEEEGDYGLNHTRTNQKQSLSFRGRTHLVLTSVLSDPITLRSGVSASLYMQMNIHNFPFAKLKCFVFNCRRNAKKEKKEINNLMLNINKRAKRPKKFNSSINNVSQSLLTLFSSNLH